MRSGFIATIASMLDDWGAGDAVALRDLLDKELADQSAASLEELAERLQTTGADWTYYPPDPVAGRISRFAHERVATDESRFHDDDGGMKTAASRPVIFLGNHLSFIDANTVDWMLHREGWGDVARRLTVLAGPKVYSRPIRRLASLAFGTIKTPQSTSRASGDAVMSRRETLRLAGITLSNVRSRRALDEHVLAFSEGARSRTGEMQRVLPAIARYVDDPYGVIVPFGVWGTDKLVPVGATRAFPSPVCVRVGAAVSAEQLFERGGRRRQVIADAIGYLTADLLPPEYRGVYAEVSDGLRDARELAAELQR